MIMLFNLFLAILVVSNEFICAASLQSSTSKIAAEDNFINSNDRCSNDNDKIISSSENLLKNSLKSLYFKYLSNDLYLLISSYLEFPHSTLGSTNRYLRNLFSTVSPVDLVARQLDWPELLNLPICPDLKYVLALNTKFMTKDRLIALIFDVSLFKVLPKIKGQLLRLLYHKLFSIMEVSRNDLIEPFQFLNYFYSPVSILLISFLALNDFEMVFAIWDEFPEFLPSEDNFGVNFLLIEAAIEFVKVDNLIFYYLKNVSHQKRFDVFHAVMSLTFDSSILDKYMAENNLNFGSTEEQEIWAPFYLKTWISALTFITEFGVGLAVNKLSPPKKISIDQVAQNLEGIKFDFEEINFLKLVVLLMAAIRTENHYKTSLLLENFPIIHLINSNNICIYESILWVLLVENQIELFCDLLKRIVEFHPFYIIQNSHLRLIISKSKSNHLIRTLINYFNVHRLFSSDLYGEAFYNKELFFKLLNVANEEIYIQNFLFNPDLLKFINEHFVSLEDWNKFFLIKSLWTAKDFALLLETILFSILPKVTLEFSCDIFKMLIHLLNIRKIIIYTSISGSRPIVHLNLEGTIFFMENLSIQEVINKLKHLIVFQLEKTVIANLILSRRISDSDIGILSLFHYNLSEVLIQLPHEIDHKMLLRFLDISKNLHIKRLKRSINNFKTTSHTHDNDNDHQDQLDMDICILYNPIFDKWKWERPLDYLLLLPNSILMHSITNDPELMKRAFNQCIKSKNEISFDQALNKLSKVLRSIPSKTFYIKGPFDLSNLPQRIKNLLYFERFIVQVLQ